MFTPKQAKETFIDKLRIASAEYGNFWKKLFEEFGFKIYPMDANHNTYYGFKIENQGKVFEVYFNPAFYQGIKVNGYCPAYGYKEVNTKILSETGIINFMRRNNIPIP